jgi:hypothetical protein
MSPGAQSRNDTPAAADTFSATRHVGQLLGTGDGVKGRGRRLPVPGQARKVAMLGSLDRKRWIEISLVPWRRGFDGLPE